VVLPGGDLPAADFEAFVGRLSVERPGFAPGLLRRLARAYGSRVDHILGKARMPADLGLDFGGGLTQAEVDYLVANEWARDPEDILYRRSKLGLHVPDGTTERLAAYLASASVRAPVTS
jgi:glycerol-3-phosphate dehydrogenase